MKEIVSDIKKFIHECISYEMQITKPIAIHFRTLCSQSQMYTIGTEEIIFHYIDGDNEVQGDGNKVCGHTHKDSQSLTFNPVLFTEHQPLHMYHDTRKKLP